MNKNSHNSHSRNIREGVLGFDDPRPVPFEAKTVVSTQSIDKSSTFDRRSASWISPTERTFCSVNKSGFALIISLSLMAFILLLLISLFSLIRVELASSQEEKVAALARQNAQMSLWIALGELQKSAGTDNRATARASILGVEGASRHWTGVWESKVNLTPVIGDRGFEVAATVDETSDNGRFLRWLVSGSPTANELENGAAANESGADLIRLFAPSDDGVREVAVPTQTVPGTGRYAFWIGGENTKANLTLQDRYAEVTHNAGNYEARRAPYPVAGEDYEANEWGERERLRNLLNRRLRPTLALEAGDRGNMTATLVEQLGSNVFSNESLATLLDPMLSEPWNTGALAHGLTGFSHSILANVPENRLKYDLSDTSFLINRFSPQPGLREDGMPSSVTNNLGKILGDAPGLPDPQLASNLLTRHGIDGGDRENPQYQNVNIRWDGGVVKPWQTDNFIHDSVFADGDLDRLLALTELGIKVSIYQSDAAGRSPDYESADYTGPGTPGYDAATHKEYYAIAFSVFVEVWNPYNSIVTPNAGSAVRTNGIRIHDLPEIQITAGDGVPRTIDLDEYFGKLVLDYRGLGPFAPGQIKLGVLHEVFRSSVSNDSVNPRFYSAVYSDEDRDNWSNPLVWPFKLNPGREEFNKVSLQSYDPSVGLPMPILHLVTEVEAPFGEDGIGNPQPRPVDISVASVPDGALDYRETDATLGHEDHRVRPIDGAFGNASFSVSDAYEIAEFPMHMGWGNSIGADSDTAEAQRQFYLRFLRDTDSALATISPIAR